MSGKMVQLSFIPVENSLEDSIKNMLKGLFARDTKRKSEVDGLVMKNLAIEEKLYNFCSKEELNRVMKRTLELEEVVWEMNNKINRIFDTLHADV